MKTFIVFILLSIPTYFYLQYSRTTTINFTEVASHFNIIAVNEGNFGIRSLKNVSNTENQYTYHLIKSTNNYGFDPEVIIKLLENSENKQRIFIQSSNTAITESVYDVIDNKVFPVKYSITATMGDPGIYFLIFIVALLITPLISKIVYIAWQKNKLHHK